MSARFGRLERGELFSIIERGGAVFVKCGHDHAAVQVSGNAIGERVALSDKHEVTRHGFEKPVHRHGGFIGDRPQVQAPVRAGPHQM